MSESSPKDYFKNKKRYVQVGHLGRGGMAVVSESIDEYFQRKIAFKTLKDGPNRNKREMEFIREAMIMAKLEHPGIVPIHDLITDHGDMPSITMGKVQGISLQAKIQECCKKPEAWPLEERLQFFLKLVEIVAYSHSRGVLHRDIKPGNVMIGEVGEVILLDWGLAKVMEKNHGFNEEDSSISRIEDTVLTSLESMSGSIKGTPYYMSPEAARGRTELVNEQSDVFSLGAVLYELITLEFYIKGTKAMEVLANAADSHTQSLESDVLISKIKADTKRLAPEIIFILKKTLEPERVFRYQSAKELQHDLIAYFNDKPIIGFGDGIGLYKIKKWLSRNGLSTILLIIPILITLNISQMIGRKSAKLENDLLEQKNELNQLKELKKKKEIELARLVKNNESLQDRKLSKLDEIESYELDELIVDEKVTSTKAELVNQNGKLTTLELNSETLRKKIQNLDDEIFQLMSTYTSLTQIQKRKKEMDQYAEFMALTPQLGSEFQFIQKVVNSGKILSSLEYIKKKDLFTHDPFAIEWYTYLLAARVEKIEGIELENNNFNPVVKEEPRFLSKTINQLSKIDPSELLKLKFFFQNEEWLYALKDDASTVFYSKSGKVIRYSPKLQTYRSMASHDRQPLEIAKAAVGFYYGRYNDEYLFYQNSLEETPTQIYHRNKLLAYNWNAKGLVIEDEFGLWNYKLRKHDYLKNGWKETPTPAIEELEVKFHLDPNRNPAYDEIIPPGYSVVNTELAIGPWLIYSSFPKPIFKNLNPLTGEINSLWELNALKFKSALNDGYDGWLVMGKEGELYSLKSHKPAKPLMPLGVNFQSIFPILHWNISISQDNFGTVHVHYLSTGQHLFNAGNFPPIDFVTSNAENSTLSLTLKNGKTLTLNLGSNL